LCVASGGAVVPDGTDDIEEPEVPEMDDDMPDAPAAETVLPHPSSHPRLSEIGEINEITLVYL
jgi:hypothetical protein